MSLAYVGPVAVDFLGNPSFSLKAGGNPAGIRGYTIKGLCDWPVAEQLNELAANEDAAIDLGGAHGVLVYVWAGDDLLRQHNGWYLLEDATLDAAHTESLTATANVSLSVAYLGDSTTYEPVVARSARPKANTLGLTSKSIVVAPFRPEAVAGDRFAIDPGGTFGTRAFDASSPHRTADLVSSDARALGFYVGTVTSSSDELAAVVVPRLDRVAGAAPKWVAEHGGMVRAYDRRDEREVFGPSHPFAVPTDLLATNGLLRFWPGSRGLVAYLHVEVFAGGAWREVGYLRLSGSNKLLAVRLDRMTPDAVTVVVTVENEGDVDVTLRRGERMIRIVHGSSSSPLVTRLVRWEGLPPNTADAGAAATAGVFGRALSFPAGGHLAADWPPSIPATAWSIAGRWLPGDATAAQPRSGILTLRDSAGPVGSLEYDDPTDRLVWHPPGGGALALPSALAFTAGQGVYFDLRFSTTAGTSLSARVGAGALVTATDAGLVDPGTLEEAYTMLRLGRSPGTGYGMGDYGEGTYGGAALLHGALDNVMVFEDRLTDAEDAVLAAAATALDGLPTPEGRLRWYLPADADPLPAGSAVTTGRRWQASTQGGADRVADAAGLTKALAVLDAATSADGLGLSATATELELAAFLATTAGADDLTDQQAQFAAESSQEVRLR